MISEICCTFKVLCYKQLQTKIAIITEDKVTEILCMADDFCKFFDAMVAKYTRHCQSELRLLMSWWGREFSDSVFRWYFLPNNALKMALENLQSMKKTIGREDANERWLDKKKHHTK